MKTLLTRFVTALLCIYVVGMMISVPYLNWQYAKQNGFVKWILLGQIVPTLQSTIWPYYVFEHLLGTDSRQQSTSNRDLFKNWSPEDRANSRHFLLSIQSDLESIRLSNERKSPQPAPDALREIIQLKETALREAQTVNDSVLDKIHPDLRQNFRDFYQRGLELRLMNLEQDGRNPAAESQGLTLHNKWADWFNDNRDRMNVPK
jgi:hypothetical protein